MTLEREQAADLFGLTGTFPRPGWVILDAARDHRFTGELVFDARLEVRVYLDRGKIYLAERATDPSLGARLVDAGVLNAAQLEHGAMRVGDAEHLGRLFERVPSVDRQTTLVVTEMMNEACVAWLAGQQVHGVTSTPYGHHPSGIHRWDRPPNAIDLNPGDPLPAPPPTEMPVEIAPPESVFTDVSGDTDALIQWNEPSWLDERRTSNSPGIDDDLPVRAVAPAVAPVIAPAVAPVIAPVVAPVVAPVIGASILSTDWADRLEQDGLPHPGDDPLARRTALPPVHVEGPDRFELIWPSGEVDADFPAVVAPDGLDDRDRAGPTARVGRSSPLPRPSDDPPDAPGLWDFETTGPSYDPPVAEPAASTDLAPDQFTEDDELVPVPDLALAMRRAVATIETGSLVARRRLSETSMDDTSRGTDLIVPGRVATRTESSVWSAYRDEAASTRSVFDERTPAAEPDLPVDADAPASAASEPEPARTSALRRLIGGLRRR